MRYIMGNVFPTVQISITKTDTTAANCVTARVRPVPGPQRPTVLHAPSPSFCTMASVWSRVERVCSTEMDAVTVAMYLAGLV